MAASGDLLIHSPVWERALEDGGGSRYDFKPLFAQIKPYIRFTTPSETFQNWEPGPNHLFRGTNVRADRTGELLR